MSMSPNVLLNDYEPRELLESSLPTIHQALSEIVTSSMPCADVVALLTNHGCKDYTDFLDHPTCSRYPIANGGLGDVFFGKLINGTSIAIKTIRSHYEPGKQARVYHKRAAKEIYMWSKCKHPNIVRLIGLAVFHDCLAMISRWEVHGSLLQYLSRHPAADRCNLSTSMCAGLAYLHRNDIVSVSLIRGIVLQVKSHILTIMTLQVHGDLKGANVLISRDGTPMLMDFGNASLLDATLQFTQTNTGPSYSLRWSPPEILEGTSLHTMAGDIYSLGMTILEAFTSQIPFSGQSDQSLLLHIVIHKKTHTRPEKVIPTRSIDGDKLWAILRKCWSYDPKDRPSAEAVWNDMKSITTERLKEIESKDEGESKDESGGDDKEDKD
ncbi:hypothetical protein ACGC1H_003124 [Rhizoctonia solani]